jgi:hypothetical protein
LKLLRQLLLCSGTALALSMTACGGHGGSDAGTGLVRVINATHSHANIDLLVGGVALAGPVPIGSAAAYVSAPGGTQSVQVSDSGTVTALANVGPSIGKDQYFTLLASENNGVVKATWLSENDGAPAAGTAALRIIDLATDAGTLDVYISDPAANLAGLGTPTFTVGASGTSASTAFLAFSPGTYRVRVTASGNKSDLRLDMPSIVLTDQQLVAVLLTPTVGGSLIDGGLMVERGAYTPALSTFARVRLVSGIASGRVVAGSNGTVVEPGAVSPSIGAYVTLPASSAAWSITANGIAAAVPPITLTPGSDNTLLLTGTAQAAVATLLQDDNHAPASSATNNMRVVNGLSGTTAGVSLAVDFAVAANNVLPGTGSGYKTVAISTNQRIEVTSALSPTPLSLQTGLSLPGGGVYSVFVLGDISAPVTAIRRDR